MSTRCSKGLLIPACLVFLGSLLLSCSSGCSPADEINLLGQSCEAGQVNELGVGQPCQVRQDCTGKAAVTCPVSKDPNGYAFCTRSCFKLVDDECGENAHCVFYEQGRGQCVPTACKDQFPEPNFPDFEEVDVPCCVGRVNEFGVGTSCTEHSHCAGLAASKCPMAIDPRLPNWCSFLCSPGDDCGEGAFCWLRPSVVEVGEGGKPVLVGSCAPLMCRSEEEPETCDPEAAANPENEDTTEEPEDDENP